MQRRAWNQHLLLLCAVAKFLANAIGKSPSLIRGQPKQQVCLPVSVLVYEVELKGENISSRTPIYFWNEVSRTYVGSNIAPLKGGRQNRREAKIPADGERTSSCTFTG